MNQTEGLKYTEIMNKLQTGVIVKSITMLKNKWRENENKGNNFMKMRIRRTEPNVTHIINAHSINLQKIKREITNVLLCHSINRP